MWDSELRLYRVACRKISGISMGLNNQVKMENKFIGGEKLKVIGKNTYKKIEILIIIIVSKAEERNSKSRAKVSRE